jgi:hypothetical protein
MVEERENRPAEPPQNTLAVQQSPQKNKRIGKIEQNKKPWMEI